MAEETYPCLACNERYPADALYLCALTRACLEAAMIRCPVCESRHRAIVHNITVEFRTVH